MSAIRRLAVPLLLLLAAGAGRAADPPPGFAGVQADGCAVVSVNVAQLWDAATLKPFHAGMAKILSDWTGEFESEYGLKIEDVERLTYYWSAHAEAERRPDPFRIVTTRKPFDRAKLVKAIGAETAEEVLDKEIAPWVARLAGKNVFFRRTQPLIFADDRTLIVAPLIGPDDVQVSDFLKVLGGTTPRVTEGPLAGALAVAGKHTAVAAVEGFRIRVALEDAPPPPAAFDPLVAMSQAERGLFTFDFGPAIRVAAELTFFDAKTAEKREPDAQNVFGLALAQLAAFRGNKHREPEADAVLGPLLAFAKTALGRAEVKRAGATLRATAAGDIEPTAKAMLAALPPWVDAKALRMKSTENLKRILIAMHTYNDNTGALPQDILDKNGRAILSWSVHLLPFMDEEALHEKLDLTKPWDDAANKKYVERMPEAFKYHGRETKEKGLTYFQTFTSPEPFETGSPLLVSGRKLNISQIPDGTANTFMVCEAEAAVNWLKPGDMPYHPKALPKFGNPKTGRFLAGMGDGTVRWANLKTVGERTLHGLITVDGGEVIGFEE